MPQGKRGNIKMPVNSYHGDRLLWGTFKLKPDLDFCRFKRKNTHKNEIQQPETTRVLPLPRRGQQICLYCDENHDIIFSPLMIFVSTTGGNQSSFKHAVLQSFSTQANSNQELNLSTRPITLHAAFAPILSRGQKGDPHREPPFLSSYFAGIASPDQRVAAVLQHRLHPTTSRGHCCCCCCCRCCCILLARRYCSGPPAETRYRDQRGGGTPPSRRRYWLPICHQRTQLLTRAFEPPSPSTQQGQQYRRSTVPPPLPRPMTPLQQTPRAPRLPPLLVRRGNSSAGRRFHHRYFLRRSSGRPPN